MSNQYKSQKQHLLNVHKTGGTMQQSKFARDVLSHVISLTS